MLVSLGGRVKGEAFNESMTRRSARGRRPGYDAEMQMRLLFVPMVAVLTLACSSESGSGGSSASSEPPAVGQEQPPRDVLDPVVADAAERVGVDPAAVTVVSATAVEWTDGSLGCPQPGMGYTQALVSGFQIIVQAGGRTLDYRVRGPGDFRLCERP